MASNVHIGLLAGHTWLEGFAPSRLGPQDTAEVAGLGTQHAAGSSHAPGCDLRGGHRLAGQAPAGGEQALAVGQAAHIAHPMPIIRFIPPFLALAPGRSWPVSALDPIVQLDIVCCQLRAPVGERVEGVRGAHDGGRAEDRDVDLHGAGVLCLDFVVPAEACEVGGCAALHGGPGEGPRGLRD